VRFGLTCSILVLLDRCTNAGSDEIESGTPS
jgi:hypothetical protein